MTNSSKQADGAGGARRANITELEPDPSSVVAACFDNPDYQDRFSIRTRPGHYESVDQAVTDWFTKQPGWLRAVSTNSLSKSKILEAIASGQYDVGQQIGSWKVFERDTNEIVFGDHMGFMDYRFSLRLVDSDAAGTDRLEGATACRFVWKRTGSFYFSLVRPFHRRFMKLLLQTTTAP